MSEQPLSDLPISLERDVFLRTLLRYLAGSLEEVIGLDDASGFISYVGQQMGDDIDQTYRQAIGASQLTRSEVAAVLVDLKQRIQGDFYIVSEDDNKIVLATHSCPFGDKVKGRPSLCMMTSNVFGTISANNLGYAKVVLNETIANGYAGCLVTVHLKQGMLADKDDGNEYFRGTP
ncbi:methanogen output domain 1-containing protein [Methylophaga sp. OBS3]|uniref:methanogen output domain 1-containing protein n=1 Tax=Methylophaga sp. OBS3 TaxID=2991934 RepID=UPI002259CD36|nr:methanogen output domain 1-containing protein [Methylophaga sp. OBS3]MCX4188867.1 methanogen output domain 1-containing protein [Methylophaga sp. OBS3]